MATTQEAPATVHVKNISPDTTEHQIRDFFSFCGKIASLSVAKDGNTQTASVTFEKPNAAKTALLLDNTQLGPNLVNVEAAASLADLSTKDPGAQPSAGHTNEFTQEDKPRSRIFAEYLAHGYTISDKAIERAIALDKQHGMSSRFTAALKDFDSKYKASEKAQSMDSKYGVSERGTQAWNGLNSYFEKALGTPTGQRVRAFYEDGSKQVMDVHTEARRLADLKTGKPAAGTAAAASGGAVPSAEEAHMEKVDAAGHTKCNCGGADGQCPCEPGKCTCAGCGKNQGEKVLPLTAGTA